MARRDTPARAVDIRSRLSAGWIGNVSEPSMKEEEKPSRTPPPIQGRYLRREDIMAGTFEAAHARELASGPIRVVPLEQRLAVKRAMLAAIPPGEDAWVFGYGSLIWNPAFDYLERRPGAVHGYHRQFCFWTPLGRGTPDMPGMMLGLMPGGSCHGVLFRVGRRGAEEQLHSVFRRELMTGGYHARWVAARTGGGTVRAITFIANRNYPNFCGRQPLETVARHIARAEGRIGACRDYLINTVRHLEAEGIRDSYLTRVLRLVENAASS
jgi:cation transport protein ChaC